jgi:tripartite-type tricarboxylate transporter receptor subunit TctC
VLARILSEPMRISLGQPLIIENVAGAAGSIGVGRVARAAGDGYMLVLGMWGTHVANAAIYALSYDVVKDFEPVALVGTIMRSTPQHDVPTSARSVYENLRDKRSCRGRFHDHF